MIKKIEDFYNCKMVLWIFSLKFGSKVPQIRIHIIAFISLSNFILDIIKVRGVNALSLSLLFHRSL